MAEFTVRPVLRLGECKVTDEFMVHPARPLGELMKAAVEYMEVAVRRSGGLKMTVGFMANPALRQVGSIEAAVFMEARALLPDALTDTLPTNYIKRRLGFTFSVG